MRQHAETACILQRTERPGAQNSDHGATSNRMASPARNKVGGVAPASKLRKSVRPMMCQPVGIAVAAIAAAWGSAFGSGLSPKC
jgi:hypothetical protein